MRHDWCLFQRQKMSIFKCTLKQIYKNSNILNNFLPLNITRHSHLA